MVQGFPAIGATYSYEVDGVTLGPFAFLMYIIFRSFTHVLYWFEKLLQGGQETKSLNIVEDAVI